MKKNVSRKIDNYLNKCENILQNIILTFTVILLAVFPLVYRNHYFDILDIKYRFYWVTVLATAVILFLCIVIMLTKDHFDHEGAAFKRILEKNRKENNIKIIVPDIALICFLIIAIISTILSDYKWESFWGNEGRFTGLCLLLFYGLCYFIISKGLKLKNWILDLCLFSGMLACLFGITDYFHMDILDFKKQINPTQYNMFVSTFGNINTYTAYVAMIMGISGTLFATAKKKRYIGWYFTCMIISFFAMVMGVSDNAYLALAAFLAFLPLYLFRSRAGIRRYAVIVASFFSVIQCIDWINQTYQGDTLSLDGVFRIIVGYSGLAYIVIALWILVGVLYWYGLKTKKEDSCGKKWSLCWLALIVVFVLAILFMLYDVNIGGSYEKYGSLAHYLKFNDDWGTHRGYIWRIAIENYSKFTPLQKIFGYGPDTFGIITINNNYYEMTRLYNEIFDSTHNEYLQYLVTIGPLGLMAYIWLLISSGIRMVKRGLDNPYIMAVLFALICYGAQAVVNINLPIATPIMWTLLMVGLAGSR